MVLTADRPDRLRNVGANQVIAQSGIFGSFTRLAVDMEAARDLRPQYWRSTVARCVAVATDSIDPGPVHINAAFDEPLVDESIKRAAVISYSTKARLLAGNALSHREEPLPLLAAFLLERENASEVTIRKLSGA